MKKLLLAFTLSLAVTLLYGQDLIPGYEFAEMGTLYITDTDSIQGVLAFSYIKNNEVTHVSNTEKKYKPGDIKGFRLHDSKLYFVSGQYGLGYKGFLQVLTPENLKMKIVKTFVSTKGVKIEPGKAPEGTWSTSLYIVSKGINYEGVKKVAEAIKADCPELADKITKKEKGYFANLMSTEEETMEVYKNIADAVEIGCK